MLMIFRYFCFVFLLIPVLLSALSVPGYCGGNKKQMGLFLCAKEEGGGFVQSAFDIFNCFSFGLFANCKGVSGYTDAAVVKSRYDDEPPMKTSRLSFEGDLEKTYFFVMGLRKGISYIQFQDLIWSGIAIDFLSPSGTRREFTAVLEIDLFYKRRDLDIKGYMTFGEKLSSPIQSFQIIPSALFLNRVWQDNIEGRVYITLTYSHKADYKCYMEEVCKHLLKENEECLYGSEVCQCGNKSKEKKYITIKQYKKINDDGSEKWFVSICYNIKMAILNRSERKWAERHKDIYKTRKMITRIIKYDFLTFEPDLSVYRVYQNSVMKCASIECKEGNNYIERSFSQITSAAKKLDGLSKLQADDFKEADYNDCIAVVIQKELGSCNDGSPRKVDHKIWVFPFDTYENLKNDKYFSDEKFDLSPPDQISESVSENYMGEMSGRKKVSFNVFLGASSFMSLVTRFMDAKATEEKKEQLTQFFKSQGLDLRQTKADHYCMYHAFTDALNERKKPIDFRCSEHSKTFEQLNKNIEAGTLQKDEFFQAVKDYFALRISIIECSEDRKGECFDVEGNCLGDRSRIEAEKTRYWEIMTRKFHFTEPGKDMWGDDELVNKVIAPFINRKVLLVVDNTETSDSSDSVRGECHNPDGTIDIINSKDGFNDFLNQVDSDMIILFHSQEHWQWIKVDQKEGVKRKR